MAVQDAAYDRIANYSAETLRSLRAVRRPHDCPLQAWAVASSRRNLIRTSDPPESKSLSLRRVWGK